MTQGTKVGLLVSLAFLIVILVLLSDHVATTSDPRPSQQVTYVGPQVAQGIATPGAPQAPAPELITPATIVAPAEPIPTAQEMVVRHAPPPQIDIGPASVRELEIRAANNNVPVNAHVSAPVEIAPGASVLSLAEVASSTDPLVKENFIPVQAPKAADTAPKSFEHTASPCDTVSKMARKYYGLDTKSNRDLIIAANPSLKSNPNMVIVGRTYVIPVKPGSISAAQAAAAPIAAAISSPVIVPASDNKTQAKERIYVVKSGDSLWKIAKNECKDVGAVGEIRKLNADILKGDTSLKVGMKLRLPPARQ